MQVPSSIPLKLCLYLVPFLRYFFGVKEWLDFETGSRGRSRSLKIAPFDRSLYDFLLVGHCKYSSVVPFSSYLTLIEKYRDLEIIWVTGHSRSFKLVPLESLGSVSYSPSMVTIALSCIFSEIKRDIGRSIIVIFSYPLVF